MENSTTNEIIRITEAVFGQETVRSVDARELHRVLESQKDFSDWMKRRIRQALLAEHVDFEVFHQTGENRSGGRPSIEYALSTEAAKHVAMLEHTEQGRKIRQFFIDRDKQYMAEMKQRAMDPLLRQYMTEQSELKFRMIALEAAVKGIDKCTIADYAHKMRVRLTPKERRFVGGKAYRESIKAGLIPGRMIGDDPKYTVRTYPLGILESHFAAALDTFRAKAKGEKQTLLPFGIPVPAGR